MLTLPLTLNNTIQSPPEPTPHDHGDSRPRMIADLLCQYSQKLESATTAQQLEQQRTRTGGKTIKLGKNPGPDGLAGVYYKTFLDHLSSRFLLAFNTMSTQMNFQHHLMEVHIMVIPKGDKDHTTLANYRPISLLNLDIKLYSKILANCLFPILPWTLVDFIPGSEASDNTIKALNLFHWLHASKHGGFYRFLDAMKAFDRVMLDYIAAFLRALGLRDNMLSLWLFTKTPVPKYCMCEWPPVECLLHQVWKTPRMSPPATTVCLDAQTTSP